MDDLKASEADASVEEDESILMAENETEEAILNIVNDEDGLEDKISLETEKRFKILSLKIRKLTLTMRLQNTLLSSIAIAFVPLSTMLRWSLETEGN
jgi:hypothetical protein